MSKPISSLEFRFFCVFGLCCAAAWWAVSPTACAADYPRENIYDTSVHADEALVNVGVAFSRWPDCTTLESAIHDIFRLEGALEKPDQEKALALWKWFRILVSATGGQYAYEGAAGHETLCHDPHKIFTVYGHHQCDGLSWAMVGLWRAAGYMALDECTLGHTTAALRYRDADGQMRYHSFDPQHRCYHWDTANERVGTRSIPVMRGMVYRHLTAPQDVHSLRTSLRIGESIERKWANAGHVIPSGKDKLAAEKTNYYVYRPDASKGVYASVGEEVQTLHVDIQAESFTKSLYDGSANVACSRGPEGHPALHPQKTSETAILIYRLPPPYVLVDASCVVTLRKSDPADVCRIGLSSDGMHWMPLWAKQAIGEERVTLNIGQQAWQQRLPNVYTAYNLFLKVELKTAGRVQGVALQDLKIRAFRMLNKRTLPNLRPGENVVRVTADQIAAGYGLELAINYQADGTACTQRRFITQFPCYFTIDTPAVPEEVYDDFDQHFNQGQLRMVSIAMRLRPLGEAAGEAKPLLREADALPAFIASAPHPATMDHRQTVARPEHDVRETSGFFPQTDGILDGNLPANAAAVQSLLAVFRGKDVEKSWTAAEDLGAYPQAFDALLAALPAANGDETLFICKALARLKDKRSIGPLLAKWKQAPRGAPGTRYIPDVLAAIGDRGVVPQLIAPLLRCRFDYRFHIAHALGILGGCEAEETLEQLAAHDPFPAVREEASQGLERVRKDVAH